MPTDTTCANTAERLESAFWSRAPSSATDAAHAAACPACGELMAALETLADSLAADHPPTLSTERARSIRQLAARELTVSVLSTKKPITWEAMQREGLPSGYLRELVRILGWALLPLPLVLFSYVQFFQFGGALLEQVLPGWGVVAVGIAAASGAASWLAVVYGSIPLVAYRRLSRLDDAFRPAAQVSP